jgi:long-chain acyl-CoA synthetase
MSDALSHALQDRGVSVGNTVALWLQNVPQFVVGVLASWKLGAVVVPINPMSRERELEFMLQDSGASALIVLDELYRNEAAEVVARSSIATVVTTSALDWGSGEHPLLRGLEKVPVRRETEDLLETIELHSGSRPTPHRVSSESLAFITYTSGTTGKPKGAMNTHGNVCFSTQVYRDWIHLDTSDVILGIAPLFHITGLIGHLTLSFLIPAPLVLSYRFDADTVLRSAQDEHATFTIGALTAFIALLDKMSRDQYDLSSLRKVYSGGQAVASKVLAEFEERTGIYIRVAYGLTETTSPSHLKTLA